MTKVTNYLFLDFDGVLNTENYQRQLAAAGAPRSDKYGPLFDPASVANLACIIEATDARICIISSWGFEGFAKMQSLWHDRHLPGTLHAVCCGSPLDLDDLDLTCDDPTPEMLVGKGRDIRHFLSTRRAPYNYVILDDVPDFFPDQMEHFVQIDPRVGVTEEVVKNITKK